MLSDVIVDPTLAGQAVYVHCTLIMLHAGSFIRNMANWPWAYTHEQWFGSHMTRCIGLVRYDEVVRARCPGDAVPDKFDKDAISSAFFKVL